MRMPSSHSRTAFSEPGSERTILPFDVTPSTARDSMAAVPISFTDIARNISPNPGSSFSISGRTDSTLMSFRLAPVPPIVTRRSASLSAPAAAEAIFFRSLGTILCETTVWPNFWKISNAAWPDVSFSRVFVSVTVRIAQRANPSFSELSRWSLAPISFLLTTMITVRIVPSPHFMADRETELMLLVKAGDRAAFEEIFRLYQKPLANYLYRLTGNRTRAEDLLQDAFLRLWKAAPSYEPSAKVSTYIFRIAHNLFLNEAARRREKALESMEAETRSDPASDLNRREIRSAVQKAIEALPEGEREVLLLSEYNGFKYTEISEILGIPVGTVKSRMFSAVQKLKESLKGLGHAGPSEE